VFILSEHICAADNAKPCPVPSSSAAAKMWRYGQQEQTLLAAIRAATDPTTRLAKVGKFLAEFPDSDYRDSVLLFGIAASSILKIGRPSCT
jgi:hypothetical protein